MTTFAGTGQHLKSYSGPSSSSRSEYSRRYDFSGLGEHIKRQDAVGSLRDEKFDALYRGDPAAAVKAGNRIRDLVSALKINAPTAGERNPVAVANPLVKVESESGSSSSSSESGGFQLGAPGDGEFDDAMPGDAQAVGVRKRNDGVAGNPPKRIAHIA